MNVPYVYVYTCLFIPRCQLLVPHMIVHIPLLHSTQVCTFPCVESVPLFYPSLPLALVVLSVLPLTSMLADDMVLVVLAKLEFRGTLAPLLLCSSCFKLAPLLLCSSCFKLIIPQIFCGVFCPQILSDYTREHKDARHDIVTPVTQDTHQPLIPCISLIKTGGEAICHGYLLFGVLCHQWYVRPMRAASTSQKTNVLLCPNVSGCNAAFQLSTIDHDVERAVGVARRNSAMTPKAIEEKSAPCLISRNGVSLLPSGVHFLSHCQVLCGGEGLTTM